MCIQPQEFDSGPIIASLECFKLIRLVYESLQDMHSHFRKTVLPRTIASLQSVDDSVDTMMAELKGMCNGPSLLPGVLYQIEQDLTSVTLGMKVQSTLVYWKCCGQVVKSTEFNLWCF